MDEVAWREWIAAATDAITEHAQRDVTALVDVSSPSGDVAAAESALAVAAALLPDGVTLERLDCSSPGHAQDQLAHLEGTGSGRLLLLGHVDTVIPHSEFSPLREEGERLYGPGTIDMKAGVALSIGVLRALARSRETFAEVALLLVVDEEWRTVPFIHAERFQDFDACLCFEGGELSADGDEAVVVARKAAGTIHIDARGRAAHSGSEPDAGLNALLALAQVAQTIAASHAPDGPDRLTVVPTVMRSGEAFNIVPAEGELSFDVRAASLEVIEALLEQVPAELDGVELDAKLTRRWPAMAMRERAAPHLARASALLGRPIIGHERGGASDASHLAAGAPLLAIDGLGPLGGGSHAPEEHILTASLRSRAEVALALTAAILDGL
jgi:glutamate carboxypeptidase